MYKNFHLENRKKFIEKIENFSISIFSSKDKIIKGDSEYFDYYDSNMIYLSGLFQANIILLILKEEKTYEEYLFIEKTNEKIKIWEGEKYSKKDVSEISKVKLKNIFYIEELDDFLKDKILNFKNIYFFKDEKIQNPLYHSYNKLLIKIKKNYSLNFINSYEIISSLRQIKEKYEIEEIKKAMKITNEAFRQVLEFLKSSKNEAQIEAILTFTYIRNFAKHAYHPIVASGSNSNILHYIRNSNNLKKNQVILIDSGAEYRGYKTDITRTFPIGGKFSKRQKEVYTSVLNVQKYAISMIKAGLNRSEWEKAVRLYLSEELIKLKLIKREKFNVLEFSEKNKIISKYYPHSTGHFLGLDTHDLGNNNTNFQEGEIYTVEPGIYIKEENFGIRIEDNILVRPDSCEILSYNIPKEIDEIEKLLK